MANERSAQQKAPVGSSGQSRLLGGFGGLSQWPWWLLLAILIACYIIFLIITDEGMRKTFWFISGQTPAGILSGSILFKGITITLTVAVCAYICALIIGLTFGLMRSSDNPFFYNIASFYVEIMRGIPMLVLLLYVSFALVGLFITAINSIGIPLSSRDIPMELRAIIALGLGYGAFSAEIFRAGIQSIESGQHEAAAALGMSYFQKMRLIVLPQAFRRILPALGNDFIAMVKDSSLVAILGVQDLTQLTRLYYSGNFLYMQSLTMLAFIYLIMVVLLTRFVRWMESRLQRAYQR
ncbi:MAG: amino acid ABC transporter permease [Caldilineaceae bacterium]|nr:amino acid ABC transporter permease [Caldilineaceae bacterium]